MTGVEALLRWEHLRHGLLRPNRFIPIAEETGVIVSIGQWVLEEAFRTAAHWQQPCPVGETPLRPPDPTPSTLPGRRGGCR